jgi:hypothetical protein
MCCIAAVGGVLAFCNGKPLSQWHLSIQPNALVSIFAVLAKTVLLYPVPQSIAQLKWLYFQDSTHHTISAQQFDDASHGSWGSIVFLWRKGFCNKKTVIASIASVVVVVSAAIEPFIQQIIHFRERQVRDSSSSSSILWTTHTYNTGIDSLLATSGK